MSLLDIVGIGTKIIDKIIPDPAAKREAEFKLIELAQAGDLAELEAATKIAYGQLEINKEEAKSANLFVAGWRPAIGWICGAGVGYVYVVGPLLKSVLSIVGVNMTLVELDIGELLALVGTMLGFGIQRSFDKSQGTATSVGGVVLQPVKKIMPTQSDVQPAEKAVPRKSRWIKE
jgi:hypothetical protein